MDITQHTVQAQLGLHGISQKLVELKTTFFCLLRDLSSNQHALASEIPNNIPVETPPLISPEEPNPSNIPESEPVHMPENEPVHTPEDEPVEKPEPMPNNTTNKF